MGFWRRLLGMNRDSYQIQALVSARTIESSVALDLKTHVICDLDKTYVETEFESWVKMARIPFERPHEKITVAGASEVLEALRWSDLSTSLRSRTPNAGLHFVSSSPRQLRTALEGKLVLDNLDWTSDTFKNQTYNLRMARIDLLRHHIAYKTKAILDVIKEIPSKSTLWLIGDNAEYDSFVYMGVKLFLEGSLSQTGLGQWIASSEVEPVVLEQVLSELGNVQNKGCRVGGILIRRLANYPSVQVEPYSNSIFMFDSWMQIAWIWMLDGLISEIVLWRLIRVFHNIHGVSLSHIHACLIEVLNVWNRSPDEGTSGGRARQSSVENVVERLRDRGVVPTCTESWKLPSTCLISMSLPAIEDPARIAKKWYRSIEHAKFVKR